MNTYDLFQGEELQIAEKIQQRRYQLLIHSCIYYHLNSNIISDMQWDNWAKELVNLQKKYPEIAEKVRLSTAFKDWDASTGAFLPITEDWVIQIAERLIGKSIVKKTKSISKSTIKVKKKLF